MGRERNLTHDIENFVTEKREKKQTDRGEYRAEDFTAKESRSANSAERMTPMMLSPTINPDARSTPSCFVASGFGVRLACWSKNHPTIAPTTIINVLCVGR